MSERDEAVSSVVGLMLVLAIIATLLAIYSATYLPGLKQQSEIVHTHEVQDAISKFGGEIEYAVAQKTTCRLSESFPLGGGDVLLSPGKSSGTLSVTEEERHLAEVFIDKKPDSDYNATLVKISYAPSFSPWELQGYTWQYGYVNVTKGGKETPLHAYTMHEVEEDMRSSPFATSFVEIRETTPPGSSGCTDILVTLVRMHPGEKSSVTGNGMANLNLNASVSENREQVQSIAVSIPADGVPPRFAEAMNRTVGTACTDLKNRYPAQPVVYTPDHKGTETRHTLEFPEQVNVTVQTIDIEVNAR